MVFNINWAIQFMEGKKGLGKKFIEYDGSVPVL